MAKKNIVKSQVFYFFCVVFLIYVCNNIQSAFLAQMTFSWFHIDLVSIIIVYLCLEHHILFSASQALIAGFLVQVYSSSPHGFFLFYFMLIVFLSNIICSFFVLQSVFAKILILALLTSIKYILFYATLSNIQDINIGYMIQFYWKDFISTFLASFIIYPLLLHFDSYFLHYGSIKKR